MSRGGHPLHLALGMAALLGAGMGGGLSDRRYERRELTLDEEEEQSVRRMLERARWDRRRTEQQRLRAEADEAARLAAAKEAARPKSRQEMRAAARKKAKRLRESRCFQKQERRP